MTSLIYLTSDYDAVYVGDLNGRIGNRWDFIEQLDDVPTRTAIDQSVKGHGEAILDFCHETKFCVINGRINPLNDNYTSISTKGTAVVDYFLTSHENLKNVKHFMVMTMSSLVDSLGAHIVATLPNKISDHSTLIMDIHVKDNDLPDISFGDDNHSDHRLYGPETSARHSPTLPPRFKVHDIPCDFMSSPEARENILSIIDMIEQSRTSQREINGIYDSIVDIHINEMRRTKNNTPHCHKKFRHTQKEWWDEELTELFRDMQKAEHNFIKAKRNKHKFKEMQSLFKCKQKHFDRIVKNKKRTCQRNKCLQLEKVNSSDPTSFWDHIKRLGPKKKSTIPMECYAPDGSIIYDPKYILNLWRVNSALYIIQIQCHCQTKKMNLNNT